MSIRITKHLLFATLIVVGCTKVNGKLPTTPAQSGLSTSARHHVLRLSPGADLRKNIEEYVIRNRLNSGAIVTCVGSLSQATLRLADQSDVRVWTKAFEITSLVGTVSAAGVHLHINLADETGTTLGGHLVDGCIVRTTAEIVIVQLDGISFEREIDAATGYRELIIRSTKD